MVSTPPRNNCPWCPGIKKGERWGGGGGGEEERKTVITDGETRVEAPWHANKRTSHQRRAVADGGCLNQEEGAPKRREGGGR